MAVQASHLAPSILFFVLYAVLFTLLNVLFARRKIVWRSRYLLLWIHVLLRLGGMACGITFAVLSWERNLSTRINVLVAYLVLSAEGYFSLVVTAYRFLIVWQENMLGHSTLEPRIEKGTPFIQRMRMNFRAPMIFVHYTLIVANAIIIAGSSILAGSLNDTEPDPAKENRGKVMRVVGTALFLALVQVFAAVAYRSYRQAGDRTLLFIVSVWPFLTVRGIYGILSVVISAFSYYSAKTYTSEGFSTPFLAGEIVMGIATEWISCFLLVLTHFSSITKSSELKENWGHKQSEAEMDEVGLAKRRSSEA